jgi:hypothetical protein
MTGTTRLEWRNNHLWRVTDKRKRYHQHIGFVQVNPFGGGVWQVFVRGVLKHTRDNERAARKTLENYAQ